MIQFTYDYSTKIHKFKIMLIICLTICIVFIIMALYKYRLRFTRAVLFVTVNCHSRQFTPGWAEPVTRSLTSKTISSWNYNIILLILIKLSLVTLLYSKIIFTVMTGLCSRSLLRSPRHAATRMQSGWYLGGLGRNLGWLIFTYYDL